jgi:hypothetical protein
MPRPGRPRHEVSENDRFHIAMNEDLRAKFDAVRNEKEKELGIQLSRTQVLSMILNKEGRQ